MSDSHKDISDDEIRIISSTPGENRRRGMGRIVAVSAAIAALGMIVAAALLFLSGGEESESQDTVAAESRLVQTQDNAPVVSRSYASVRDTAAAGVELRIITPVDARPVLELGENVIADTTAVLAMQAADIRSDNGGIVGTFVLHGELLSKGEKKTGYCSIVNGEVTIGAADATPMLEQALTADGYFFRQYPLVVGGQVVENKPKGRALRKALAEIDGRICVAASLSRVTFSDFSRALVAAGATNAIYLVGAESPGFYRDSEGRVTPIWSLGQSAAPNVNFIVWR